MTGPATAGSAAFELVLHHRYANGEPHDLSGNGNLGFGASRRVPGRQAPASAAAFDGATDRVYVPPSPTLTRPGGIRAELVVKLDELGQRRTLIEGYLSFAFGVERDGSLGGSVYRAMVWNGMVSRPGLVPLHTWITVTFQYTADGVLALALDGEPVAASYRQLGDAHGVAWPFGLSIGAWPDGDQRVWKGSIEEVMVWRSPQ
jgi:hypothetical protein